MELAELSELIKNGTELSETQTKRFNEYLDKLACTVNRGTEHDSLRKLYQLMIHNMVRCDESLFLKMQMTQRLRTVFENLRRKYHDTDYQEGPCTSEFYDNASVHVFDTQHFSMECRLFDMERRLKALEQRNAELIAEIDGMYHPDGPVVQVRKRRFLEKTDDWK
jgi:hypothetical protein